MEQEVILYKIEVDVDKAQKAVIDYQVELEKLKKEKKAIEEANKKGELSEEEYAKAIVQTNNAIKQASQAQKDATKQIELADKAVKANKNSYQSLTLQYQEAKKKLNELEDAFSVNADGTIELTDAYKEQAEQVKKLKDAIIEFDQGVSDGRTNVGNYADSLKEALANTSLFGVSVGNAKEGLKQFTEGGIKGTIKNIFDLSKAILASPLFLLTAVVGGLIAVFSKSRAVTQAFGQAVEALGQVFNAIFKLIEPVIEGFASIVEFSAEAISGIVGFFDSGVKNSASLEKNLQGINDKLVLQADIQKKLELEAQKQKNIVEDTTQATEDRLKASRKQFEFESKSVDDVLKLEQSKAKVLEQQIKTLGNTNERFEKQKELTEQNAKVADLINQKEKFREELIKKTNELLTEQRSNLIALDQANLNLALATGKIRKDSKEQLDAEKKLIKDKLDIELQGTKDIVKQDALIAQAKADIANKEIEFIEKINEKNKQANDKRLQDAQAKAKAEIDLANQIANDEIQANLSALQKQLDDFDAQTAKLNLKDEIAINQRLLQREELETQFAEQQKALRKQQEKEELQALEAQAKELRKLGINTAKLEAEEKNKIKLQAIADINKIELDLQLANAERSAKLLESQLQRERDIRLNFASLNLQDARNSQLQAEIAQKSAFEERIKVAEEQYTLELEQNRQNFETNRIDYEQYLANLQTASLNYEKTRTDAERQAQQERLDAQFAFEQARLSTVQAFTDAAIAIAGKNEEIARGLQVFQKALALFEVGLNLQRQLSNINLTGAKLDATLPGSGVAYRVFAIASAVAQGAKIIADIKKLSFASGGYTGEGFGNPDGTGYKVAGIVHENEYVVPERVMNTQRGAEMVRQLESMRLKPYAAGGLVLPTSSSPSATELAGVFVSAMSQLPNPVVGVREIARVANQVQTIEQLRTF